jgi:hypothetical protein
VHQICEDWARKHGAKFAPDKYSLIHFSRTRSRHNMQACIQIQGHETQPSPSIRLLGLWLDPKLSWGPHVQKIQARTRRNMESLNRLTASTWGVTFSQARQLYAAIVRPVLTYGSQVWATPKKNGTINKTLVEPLHKVQTECLRKITGAYKSTNHRALEHETEFLPMDIYLEQLRIQYAGLSHHHRAQEAIDTACTSIERQLCSRRSRQRIQRITQKKNDVTTWRQATQAERNAQAAWAATHPQVEPNEKRQRKARDIAVKKRAFKQWQQQWNDSSHHITAAMPKRWNASTLLNAHETQDREAFGCVPVILHRGLTRAQSSIATQLRTEHIGLRTYLHRRRVPGVESPACPCGYQSQNVKHMLTRCDQWSRNRGLWLRRASSSQFIHLLHESDNVSRITKWIIHEGFLEQFRLAQPVEDIINRRAAARKRSHVVVAE